MKLASLTSSLALPASDTGAVTNRRDGPTWLDSHMKMSLGLVGTINVLFVLLPWQAVVQLLFPLGCNYSCMYKLVDAIRGHWK